jgi:hypothetical protein
MAAGNFRALTMKGICTGSAVAFLPSGWRLFAATCPGAGPAGPRVGIVALPLRPLSGPLVTRAACTRLEPLESRRHCQWY